jgi:hypothetical protein
MVMSSGSDAQSDSKAANGFSGCCGIGGGREWQGDEAGQKEMI